MSLNDDPRIWGPYYWFVLHNISKTFPVNPTETCKKKYYEFIQNIPIFIPNVDIGNYFATLLGEYPVSPYLDTRISLMKWMHFIHNKVNQKIGKTEISYSQYIRHFDEIYNNKKNNTFHYLQEQRWVPPKYKRVLIIGIIGILLATGYNLIA